VTQAEAVAAIRVVVEAHRDRHPEGGSVPLVVKRSGRPPRGERVRVLPGVMGELLCENAAGELVVRVEVAALERWLKRADVPALKGEPA
jgi:hypothetical protein